MLRAFFSRSVARPLRVGIKSFACKGLYASSVFALTVFFVGLTIWRVPVEGYVVISEVGMADADQSAAGSSGPRTAGMSEEDLPRSVSSRWRMPFARLTSKSLATAMLISPSGSPLIEFLKCDSDSS